MAKEKKIKTKVPKKKRKIGTAALILAFLGPFCIVGIAFAILDLISDKKKEYKHGLSIAALIISFSFIGILIYALFFADDYPIDLPVDLSELFYREEEYDEYDDEESLDEDEYSDEYYDEEITDEDFFDEEFAGEDEFVEEDKDFDDELESEEEIMIMIDGEEYYDPDNYYSGRNNDSDDVDSNDEDVDEAEVSLNIPAKFVGDMSQAELNEMAEENGYKSIKLNSDGSVTYILTKSQHMDLIEEIAMEIDDRMDEMVGSDEYPNFTSVEANEDYTSFIITTTSETIEMDESAAVMELVMYGGMYAVFSGNNVNNIHVDFVNFDTDEIIHSADSKDMAQSL